MKKGRILLASAILTTFFFENCQPCDDCQISPAPKQINVVDKNGNNLIYGTSAVYAPDEIEIKNNFGQPIEFFENTTSGTIDFTFAVSATTYFIKLSSTDSDTIIFTYGKDKHIDCCNEFDVTDATNLNGKSVTNDDKITIVK
ncbi:MAG: hypothetical protein ACKVQB_08330 [Bacteroidia bacterium]